MTRFVICLAIITTAVASAPSGVDAHHCEPPYVHADSAAGELCVGEMFLEFNSPADCEYGFYQGACYEPPPRRLEPTGADYQGAPITTRHVAEPSPPPATTTSPPAPAEPSPAPQPVAARTPEPATVDNGAILRLISALTSLIPR